MPASPTGISFRPDIQGLRALAVGLVILAHAGVPGLAGGYVGVDVFFVLSGYLITGLLVQERLATGRIRYLPFLARRLRRLLPAMLTMLLVILLLGSILLTAFEMRMQARAFPYAAAWISNFFFAFAERDYFQALQDDDLFLHTWSLGVEEQFYLLWPWLVLVLAGLRVADGRLVTRGRHMVAAMAMIGVASFIVCVLLTQVSSTLAFYMMPARIWQFALGAIVFAALHLARAESATPRARWTLPAGIVGLVLVLGSALLLDDGIAYPGWYALGPSLGATLLIAAGTAGRRNAVNAGLELRPLVWIGDRSYSLYLWHWPVLTLGTALGVPPSWLGGLALVAVAVMLAAFSYRFVELPFWKGSFRSVIPRHAVLYGLAAIVVAATVFLSLDRTVFGQDPGTVAATDYDPRLDLDPRIYKSGRKCDTGRFDAALVPCSLGNPAGRRKAILFGDSIAAHWAPALADAFPSPEWDLVVLTKSYCAVVDKTYFYDKVGGDYVLCTAWRNDAIEYIRTAQADVLVASSSATYDFSADDWTSGTARILEQVAPAVGQVVVIAGIPGLTFDGPTCLEDPWRFSFRLANGTRECEEELGTTLYDDVAGYLSSAAAGFSNVSILDFGDLACPDRRCAARTVDGMIVFRDPNHFTATYARTLAPEIRRRLVAADLIPAIPARDTPSQ